ncbi:CaiB/BaiF CoA transferase family protein [Microbacterium sp.]|uniref:CaiB/BaiF CoA transferase family protein n=1 Tax=Microbacterium sp. TaxID=51671 RepID=UPI003C203C46
MKLTTPSSETTGPLPLAGIRVLDLSTTFSGPYCTHLLAHFGAEVIKLEPPSGDISRTRGTARNPSMASIFLTLNAGKRSIVVDMKSAGGQEVFRRLCGTADVLVHNMRASATERISADYATVSKINPQIVYAGIAGYGHTGRYAGAPAYDDIIQAMSGLADLQGNLTPTHEPTYVASAVADKVGGMAAAMAILAALHRRNAEGVGSEVEVPMLEVVTGFTLLEHLAGQQFRPAVGPAGYVRMLTPRRRPYKTADGYLAVMPYTGRHWESFLNHIGRGDLLSDPLFSTEETRAENSAALYEILEEALLHDANEGWLERLRALDVPAMPVHTMDTVFEDPHLVDVDFFQQLTHPSEGEIIQMRSGITFDRTPPITPLAPAQRLGQSTNDVLAEIGFTPEEIDELRTSASVAGVE